MKAKSIHYWLVLIGASGLLNLTIVQADPEKADKTGAHQSDKTDKPDKPDKPNVPNKGGNPDNDKADKSNKPDHANRDNKADHTDRVHRADNGDKSRKADMAGRDRPDNRADRPKFKKGEFKERFAERDREHVVTYFSRFKDRDHGLPPGLNWNPSRRLPDGWRTRVAVGYVIEPDWMVSFQPVPYSWFPDLVVVPDTRLYYYGDRVVRVYEPTREVVDVIMIPTIQIDL